MARDAAEAAGLPAIDIGGRDVDLPLSVVGERQACALGRWFANQVESARPTVVLASPYVRAMQTAELVLRQAALGPDCATGYVIDERLREREPGSLARLTRKGIIAKFPEEAEAYGSLGKFYYRPPGGESWCDVILRLRCVMDHLQLQYTGERVLIVAHQVTVLCFRYLLEGMNEAQVLLVDRQKSVANCSVTAYELDHGTEGGHPGLRLRLYNFVAPLEQAGTPVTTSPDAPDRPR